MPRGKPDQLVGGDVVASWLGVSCSAVSNWHQRGVHLPVEPVLIHHASGKPTLAWPESSRPVWEAWQAMRGTARYAGKQKKNDKEEPR